ncbi:MAG TPA: citrate/2-methylcitrate synthase, partial [Thermomicrobiales bacterium]|nr:citrate/2-methylcitrate synthase [Thermomicrobiales bacterium]
MTNTATATSIERPKPNGLEGVVAASTELSQVLGDEGKLVYRGYDIHELAGKASFEEVAHLLFVGHLPNRDELDAFEAKFGENRVLPDAVITGIQELPRNANPMDALRTGVSMLGANDPTRYDNEPDLDEAIGLAARFPAILATFFRHREGLD